MKILVNLSLMIFLISLALVILLNFISKKAFQDREKSSPFECGFDPKTPARLPFSLQFFLIAVIFLIFDVEITLLLPMISSLELSNMFNYSSILMFFLVILLVGLYHEWNQGALDWAY
uniref:NADH-ubiquinone oxidoreductase chain 3 n=1 Tax=Aegosoma sinicum TaxID=2020310 RepID=A0A343ERE1_9CUCU|nr:NADH dehydrogenase subunit 3 [Aegosoma sinicum]ASL05647.1 NADH dehydrogenase subunit 3 [Aegosoma sinicum]